MSFLENCFTNTQLKEENYFSGRFYTFPQKGLPERLRTLREPKKPFYLWYFMPALMVQAR